MPPQLDSPQAEAGIAVLQTASLTLPMPQVENHEAESEVLGQIDQLSPEEWVEVVGLLEPFGLGNPFPLIAAEGAICKSEPVPLNLRDGGKAWGVKAEFDTKADQIITPVWRDVEKALTEWAPGHHYDLHLEVAAKQHRGRVYFNWAVTVSRQSTMSAGSHSNYPSHAIAVG